MVEFTVSIGYSLNFTGPGATVSLIGDRVTKRPVLPVIATPAEVQAAKSRTAKKNAPRVAIPQPEQPRTACWCGRRARRGKEQCSKHQYGSSNRERVAFVAKTVEEISAQRSRAAHIRWGSAPVVTP